MADSFETKSIVFIDAVNFTEELKIHGRPLILPKINQLRDFADYFFVHRLKGSMIGELGDGFLILCPPEPHRVIQEAFACMEFVRCYNHERDPPLALNVRIAIHYGLMTPAEGGNYVDTNINLTSRIEGATPPNSICVSSVVRDIVADTLRQYNFEQAQNDLKGFGQTRFYLLSLSGQTHDSSKAESRLSFYLSTLEALRQAEDWIAVANTSTQALRDFRNNPEFYYQLGLASLLSNKPEEAIPAFQECVRDDYKIADSLHFIGTSYLRLKNESNATDAFLKAIKSNPKKFHSMCEMAEICWANGKFSDSWTWTKRALKFAPRYFRPIAHKAVFGLLFNRRISLEWTVRMIPVHNLILFHSRVRAILRSVRAGKRLVDVDSALISIFGKDWRRRATLADRALMKKSAEPTPPRPSRNGRRASKAPRTRPIRH